jgi:uncharacterized protein (DUF362 family)
MPSKTLPTDADTQEPQNPRESAGVSRRDFLKLGLGAAALALLPRFMRGEEPVLEGPVIVRAKGDSARLVKAAVDELGGIEQFVKAGETVCLKPNISFAANKDCGATTSAGIVRQVVELCLDAGADRVLIVDYPLANAQLCIKQSGIEDAIVDKKKVSVLMLSQERQFSEVAIPGTSELGTVKVAKAVLDADRFINLPTAKSHSASGVSLGMKNLMGVVWDRQVFHRLNLHQSIAELAQVVKPDLILVDATRALTTGGPGGPGKTVELNTVVAGTDQVAVDACAVELAEWYGRVYTGSNVKYIAAAAELGLGEISLDKMQIRDIEV